MSQAMRKLTSAIARSDCAVIFINQIREKIGVMFGSPETTTGGRALKFYASVRLDIRRIGQIKEGEDVVGSRAKVTVVKNKIAPPFRKVEFDIMFDRGISYEGDLIDLGILHGQIIKSGTWFSFKHPKEGEVRLGQGREKARQLFIDNPELARELDSALRAKLAGGDGPLSPDEKAPLPKSETKAADAKPAEAKPFESKVGDAKPAPERGGLAPETRNAAAGFDDLRTPAAPKPLKAKV